MVEGLLKVVSCVVLSIQSQIFIGLNLFAHKNVTTETDKLLNCLKFYDYNDKNFKRVCKGLIEFSQSLNGKWYKSNSMKLPAEEYILLTEIKKCRIMMSKRPFL